MGLLDALNGMVIRFTPNSDRKSRHAANGHVCFAPEGGHS
jgi:hypothetical protein